MLKKIICTFFLSSVLFSCKSPKPYVVTDEIVLSEAAPTKKPKYVYDTVLSDDDKKHYAKKLDVSQAEILNEKLYIFIKSWEGTRYVWGGETRNGIDCSALMQQLYSFVYKKDLPRTAEEMTLDSRIELFKSKDKLREGDLVFFRITDQRIITHVGIYLKNNRFFAANMVGGVEIASLKKAYWKNNFMAAGRFKQQ